MKLHKKSINISKKVQLIVCGQILLMALFFVNNYDLLGGIADTALKNRPGFLSPSIRNLNDISDFYHGEGFITPDQLTEAQLIYGLASATRITVSAPATGHKGDIEALGLGNVFAESSAGMKNDFLKKETTDRIYNYEEDYEQLFSEFIQIQFLNSLVPSLLSSIDTYGANYFLGNLLKFTTEASIPALNIGNEFIVIDIESIFGNTSDEISNGVASYFDITNYQSVYNVPALYNDFYTFSFENQNISPPDTTITQKFCNVVAGNLVLGTANNVVVDNAVVRIEKKEQQYNLKSGVLSVNADDSGEYIGCQADATFNHTGGINETKSLILGVDSGVTGTYNLDSGAALYAQTQVIGTNGIGSFNHNGGINTAKLMLMGLAENSEGTYILNVSHTKEEYELLTSSDQHDLNADQIILGKSGNAKFYHVQGTNKVSYSLLIGDDFLVTGSIYLMKVYLILTY